MEKILCTYTHYLDIKNRSEVLMKKVYALITKMDAKAYWTKDTLALEIESITDV